MILRWGGKAMIAWVYLTLAVAAEVFGTSMLKIASQELTTRAILGVVAGYATAFGFLMLTLRTLPLGVSYAAWSGLGTALVALVGWVVFGQRLSPTALFGMALIVAGVVVLHLASSES